MKKIIIVNKGVSVSQVAKSDGCCMNVPSDIR